MPLDGKMHGGHRTRIKERFIRDGLDSFEEHNILEMLLFYPIPQKDTNELAHDLLNRFGSLEGVFNADVEQLLQVGGVGEHTALFLTLFSEMTESYIEDRRQNEIIIGMRSITEFAVRKLAFSPTECLLIIFIDNKQCMLNWHCLQEGFVSADSLDIRTVMRMVMGTNTTHVLLGRNYLKGKCSLRKTDLSVASQVSDALRGIGVGLFDYIAVGSNNTVVTLNGNADFDFQTGKRNAKAGDGK